MASDLSFELALPLAPREREPEFLARAIEGDHEAYAKLVRPYERVAYRVAAAITGRQRGRGGGDAERLREGVPLAPPLPGRGRLQAVAAPDRGQRGAQRAPSRATAREARRARRRAARDGDRGRGRSRDRARGGRDGAGRARSASGRRSTGARAAVLRRAAGRRGRRARRGRRRRRTASASCARGSGFRRCWRKPMAEHELELRLRAVARELDAQAPAFDLGLLRSAPRRRIRGRVVALACVVALAGVAAAPAAVSALRHLFDVDEVPELGPLAPGVAPPFAGRSVPVDAVQASRPVPRADDLVARSSRRRPRARRHHGRDGHARLRRRNDPADAVADDRRVTRASRSSPSAAPPRTSRSETCRPSGSRAPRGGRSRSSAPTERFTARASRSAAACCSGTTTG